MRIQSSAFLVVALVGPIVPDVVRAEDGATSRPLSDFLENQGKTSTFFPPVPDYVGWADGGFVFFALIDYAGLAAEWLAQDNGPVIGTSVSGHVIERENEDGTAEVTVVIHTNKALALAQCIDTLIANDFDFANTPTIFGEKAVDVRDGAVPSTGQATLRLTFTNSEPGADLPDFLDIVNTDEYEPFSYDFKSTAIGTLTGEPCSDQDGNVVLDPEPGTKGLLRVHQSDEIGGDGKPVTFETVEILELGP